jgi:hypothetical protein
VDAALDGRSRHADEGRDFSDRQPHVVMVRPMIDALVLRSRWMPLNPLALLVSIPCEGFNFCSVERG